jgi:hypothetical protein
MSMPPGRVGGADGANDVTSTAVGKVLEFRGTNRGSPVLRKLCSDARANRASFRLWGFGDFFPTGSEHHPGIQPRRATRVLPHAKAAWRAADLAAER